MTPATWNIVGIICGLAGVLILFRYGMPFRVSMEGYSSVVAGDPDPVEIARDSRYRILGYVGLALIFAGAACQIWAAYAG